MKTLTLYPHFFLFAFKTAAEAQAAERELSSTSQILESGEQQAGHFYVLGSSLQKPQMAILQNAVDSVFIENIPAPVLLGYFKLSHVKAQQGLLHLEAEKLSDLFKTTTDLVTNYNFEVIEILRYPTKGHKATAILANGRDPSQALNNKIVYKWIPKPSLEELKKFN